MSNLSIKSFLYQLPFFVHVEMWSLSPSGGESDNCNGQVTYDERKAIKVIFKKRERERASVTYNA